MFYHIQLEHLQVHFHYQEYVPSSFAERQMVSCPVFAANHRLQYSLSIFEILSRNGRYRNASKDRKQLRAACQLFVLFFWEAQALLQYFISGQVFSHFFRQVMGLPQTTQGFCGK